MSSPSSQPALSGESSTDPSTDLIPPALAQRPLLSDAEVAELSDLFGILSSETRLRILHVIARHGEVSVSDIAQECDVSTQAVSNHLQRMQAHRIVSTRRDGNRIYYRLVDPCVGGVMELGLCLRGHHPCCDTDAESSGA